MIRTPFLSGVVFITALLTAYMTGCVDVPSTGPAPPNYTVEVRVINLDPALTNATLDYANGPFSTTSPPLYTDFALGAVADNTQPYGTWLAGGKKMLVKGVDADTSALTFSVDQHGTLYVIPTTDITVSPRFVYAVERYKFAANGIADTSRVNFFNALVTKDTVDFRYTYTDANNNLVKAIGAQGVAFSRFSSTIVVPAGLTLSVYATAPGDTVAASDVVNLTTASNKDFTVAAYGDSLKASHVQQIPKY